MNHQPIEKRTVRQDGVLEVHSIFHTIQGEGPFCGTPAVFIRLAGCNLQCPACDTDYTSNRFEAGPHTLLDMVLELQTDGLVVITGGEPFRQHIAPLLRQLIDAGFYVQIESNGTLDPVAFEYTKDIGSRRGVYIVCSPKTGRVHPHLAKLACAFKYVLEHNSIHTDGLPLHALQHGATPYVARPPIGWSGPIYVQPMDSHDPLLNRCNLDAAIKVCMQYGYILQLQIHKIINLE